MEAPSNTKESQQDEEKTRITKEQSEEQMLKSKMKTSCRWMTGSLVLMLMFLVVTVSSVMAWVWSVPSHDRYLVLLDAGSVHTAVYTYRYSYSESGTVNVTETNACEAGQIGISEFKENPILAAHYITNDTCVLESINKIPEEIRPYSMIQLVATAGMRIIRLSDPVIAQQIIGNVSQQLGVVAADTAGPAGGMSAEAEIMSGETEAVSGWVSAFTLAGDTVAALDWGGASAQVTLPSATGHAVTINGEDHLVTGISNLCYGQLESRNRHNASLVYNYFRTSQLELEDITTILNITDPCLPSGIVLEPVSISQLYSSPCTQLLDTEFLEKAKNSSVMIRFVSGYNYDECNQNINTQFSTDQCLSLWQPMTGELTCLDPSEFPAPAPGLQYYAMSTYWYMARGLGLNPAQLGVTPHFTLDQLTRESRDICQLEHDHVRLSELEKNGPSACYQSVLMINMLTRAYHFNETNWDQLHVVKKMNGAELGWSLGHAMIHANLLIGHQYLSFNSLVILLVFAGVLLLLSVLAAYKGKQAKRYAPLRDLM